MSRLLMAEEVAERWGLNVETVYRWAISGVLPRVVLSSRAVRFREEDVERVERDHLQGRQPA